MFAGWKTFLFGLLVTLAVPTTLYFETLKADLMTCATDQVTKLDVCALPDWVGPVVGVMIVGLRVLTTTKMFKKS